MEPSWGTALKFWWAFTWRWPLLMLVPLVPLAILIALAKPGPESVQGLIPLITWPCALGAQIVTFRRILRPGFLGTEQRNQTESVEA